MPQTKVKVGVVGSGLAGLTAAYELVQQNNAIGDVEFEVHVFEKMQSLGMDCASASVQIPGQERDWRIDVPMRSFQGGYYPRLIELYKRVGVSFREADFTYSFSTFDDRRPTGKHIITNLIYNGSSGRAGLGMPSILRDAHKQIKNEGLALQLAARAWSGWLFVTMVLQLLVCYLRMLLLSVPVLRNSRIPSMSLRQWTDETTPRNFLARWVGLDIAWVDFTSNVLLPLFSAICTASKEDIIEHPVEEMLDYIWLTFGTHHYLVRNGVADVVNRLTSPLRHIHLSSPISSIYQDPQNPGQASISCISAGGTKTYSGFDHIIFATQATRAVPILEAFAASLPESAPQAAMVAQQVECLRTFRYTSSIVINHTDDTLLPDDLSDRRELNLVDGECAELSNSAKLESYCVPPSYTMTTQILHQPSWYTSSGPLVLQTTNPIMAPREDKIISVSRLERAIMTITSKEALEGLYVEDRRWWQCAGQGKGRLGRLQGVVGGDRRSGGVGIWFCGSYVYNAIPLLEGCVVSGQLVAESILKTERGGRE